MPLPAVLFSPAAGVRQSHPHSQKLQHRPQLFKGGGSSSKQQHVHKYLVQWILLVMVLFAAVAYGVFAYVFLQRHQQQSAAVASFQIQKEQQQQQQQQKPDKAVSPACEFRQYPPHRYYQLSAPKQPDFLLQTEYIYGSWPQMLPILPAPHSEKLCVDQTSWHSKTDLLPFADGTNPSIITRTRYETLVHPTHQVALPSEVQYIATVCMTNSQCHWKDSRQEMKDGRINPQRQPDTVRTLLLLLDANFQTIHQATIYVQLDARYGTSIRHGMNPSSKQQHHLPALDDARLFVHGGQLWISYREGKLFGYEAQVLNPVHIQPPHTNDATTTTSSSSSWSVHLLASETTSFCCGRNMALMEPLKLSVSSNGHPNNNNNNSNNAPTLQSLTWVDPVTVIHVDTTTHVELAQQKAGGAKQKRRLLEGFSKERGFVDNSTLVEGFLRHRQLAEALPVKKQSHIHGTNAFMVYLKDRHEYLGVAHFHRPNDRQRNAYARFGHHYTHCFYTITAEAPYRLATLSPEFLLPSAVGHESDGEIIQFISGVEVREETNHLILAYGINDCEAASVALDYKVVAQQWLKPVQEGKQVVDYMKPLDRSTLPASQNHG